MKITCLLFFLALLLIGCSSPSEATSSVTQTTPVTSSSVPKPTDWLPYKADYSADGCGDFTATIAISGTQNLSQLDISRKLFEIYLGHYRSSGLGSVCRLEDFKVEHVDHRFANLADEQKVDFVNAVEYSVQAAEAPTDWAAGNGELSPEGWIVHKVLIIGVKKDSDEYVLKLIGTGP